MALLRELLAFCLGGVMMMLALPGQLTAPVNFSIGACQKECGIPRFAAKSMHTMNKF